MMPLQDNSLIREVDWSGVPLTDRGTVDEIDALIGNDCMVMGQQGVIEAIWLVEGHVPWPGPPWPRPVYRVRWRLVR